MPELATPPPRDGIPIPARPDVTHVAIRAGEKHYDALIGRGLLAQFGDVLPDRLRTHRCAVIADENTVAFARTLATKLPDATVITVRPGELSKSLECVAEVCDRMLEARLDRSAFVIGVGGGVVSDLSGFVAAIFHRGIPHVQVPTTLLAMVDSAIGGKCGVNTRAGKNLLGAIHQPRLIVCDTSTLDSLPEREMRQGFAEIVKHAIIRDAEMFGMLSSRAKQAFASNDDDLRELIQRNIEIKAAIVAEDERDESGERALLNFGHTIGHAIERAGNYEMLRHGEAISIGIVAACNVSVNRAGLSEREHADVIALLNSLGLPTRLPAEISRDVVFDAVRFDKKFSAGQVRFVVTPRIGEAYLSEDVTFDDIREAIALLL